MDIYYAEALIEARKAFQEGEVPVGCVLVKDGEILGRGHNQVETRKDGSAHAEVEAIRDAARRHGDWRLAGSTLYVTLEPCLMCAALIKRSRIRRVVIGTYEEKEGAFGSTTSITHLPPDAGPMEVTWLMDPEAETLMKEFFKKLRSRHD